MKKAILLIAMFALIGLCADAQIMFQKIYSGLNNYSSFNCVRQTFDGGFIALSNYSSIQLFKTKANGDTLWVKSYPVTGDTQGASVQQTLDSGYIICGTIFSPTQISYACLIKTNSLGDTLWTRSFSAGNLFSGTSVCQTRDSGYIFAGLEGIESMPNMHLIKLNAQGDTLWSKFFGSLIPGSLQETMDGGIIMTGTNIYTSDLIFLIKTNSTGDTLWSKEFGGANDDYGKCVRQTSDNGYIITGYTTSSGAGGKDIFLIRTDSLGDTLWTKTYGGAGDEKGYAVQQTSDGGFIITGYTNSFGIVNDDAYLIKTNSNGDTLWTKTYGGSSYDYGNFVQQLNNGGYIISGSTMSFSSGNVQGYLIRTDSLGNSGCNQTNPPTIQQSFPVNYFYPPMFIRSGCDIANQTIFIENGGITSTICYTGLNEISYDLTSLFLSPNPFTTQATLTFQGIKNENNKSLSVYNLLGQEVQNIFVGKDKEVIIHRNNLPSGMYFYKLLDDNKTVLGVGKMVVE
ncbi:MAG: T9SS type A sorting domain-containing protein [Bacteroidota bacterium]